MLKGIVQTLQCKRNPDRMRGKNSGIKTSSSAGESLIKVSNGRTHQILSIHQSPDPGPQKASTTRK
jgi:hypothetical protein